MKSVAREVAEVEGDCSKLTRGGFLEEFRALPHIWRTSVRAACAVGGEWSERGRGHGTRGGDRAARYCAAGSAAGGRPRTRDR